MNVSKFIIKWRQSDLSERSGSQQHFCDLCELVDHPKPAEADPKGEWFTFEKGAKKPDGSDGWADVWKKGFFAWEYKGKHKDLDAAYGQLLKYREALESPPLLVVCDMERLVIHTNFTATVPKVYEITLLTLKQPENLEIVRALFHDPQKLRPGVSREAITEKAAQRLAAVAQRLRDRGFEPHIVARFLDRIVFCLFAEDIGLLPQGVFSALLTEYRHEPEQFTAAVQDLFGQMATGGRFGVRRIRHFNGDLFEDVEVLPLEYPEIESIQLAARLDWDAVDASIFGTLFERGMDPSKRAQLGLHYTSRADIETLVEPVVMAPLRREWEETRATVESLLTTGKKSAGGAEESETPLPLPPEEGENSTTRLPLPPAEAEDTTTRLPLPPGEGRGEGRTGAGHASAATPRRARKPLTGARLHKARGEAEVMIDRFLKRLARVTVLDPACGSGNFLYVTLGKLKDLEKEVIIYAAQCGFRNFDPAVGPWQFHGIEINPYAFELAQLTIWIGYLQWLIQNGFDVPHEPVLRPMDTFENKDAILDLSDPDHPREPTWPKVDFIVGNPPFLGDKKMRGELGDDYVESLRRLYSTCIPARSDLCCYWFEKARAQLADRRCSRVGLLATQGIRGGDNRTVLERVQEEGRIFWAVSDRPWILDGATVHVSMVAFDMGEEAELRLDGSDVGVIYSNLTGGDEGSVDVTKARSITGNGGLCFLGVMKAGPFDIPEGHARELLVTPNPHGRPNSDVLRPRLTARDVLHKTGGGWIIDFGCSMSKEEAALYEAPWEHVAARVEPMRAGNRRKRLAEQWWIHGEPRPGLRHRLKGLRRFIVTPEVSKHRVFAWLGVEHLADHQTRAFVREDDFFFGVLHSRLHESWARAVGTQLRERQSGFRYTPTTCFETFPFPEPTAEQAAAIAEAARDLNALREQWLNPPEWVREEILEFPGTVGGPWTRYIVEEGSGLQVPGSGGGCGEEGSGCQVPGSGEEEGPAAGARNPEPGTRNHSSSPPLGTVRYPRLVPRDAECAAKLKKRTLTNLYNARPTWLDIVHRTLDAAVFAAYGWDPDLSDEQILEKLLALNLERAAAES